MAAAAHPSCAAGIALREGGGVGARRGGGGVGGRSLENLHTVVEGISHDDAPVAVDGNAAKRVVQLSVA